MRLIFFLPLVTLVLSSSEQSPLCSDQLSCSQCASLDSCHWCSSSSTQGCFDDSSSQGCFSYGGIKQASFCSPSSCQRTQGCTNESALNFWRQARVSNEATCIFPEAVSGCTDSMALNYDVKATEDDGSCVYPKKNAATSPEVCGSIVKGKTWSNECICSNGGLDQHYGAYCGNAYSGCRGRQACDPLDFCCQLHDHCVNLGSNSVLSCQCNRDLLHCLKNVTGCGFCGRMEAARNTLYNQLSAIDQICFPATPASDDSYENSAAEAVKQESGGFFSAILGFFEVLLVIAAVVGIIYLYHRYKKDGNFYILKLDIIALVQSIFASREPHSPMDMDNEYRQLNLNSSEYRAMA